jgi:hypothetical protein
VRLFMPPGFAPADETLFNSGAVPRVEFNITLFALHLIHKDRRWTAAFLHREHRAKFRFPCHLKTKSSFSLFTIEKISQYNL